MICLINIVFWSCTDALVSRKLEEETSTRFVDSKMVHSAQERRREGAGERVSSQEETAIKIKIREQ